MHSSIQIRRVTSHDFNEIVALLQQLWPDKTLHVEQLRNVYDQALHSDSQIYLCTDKAGAVIGFGSLSIKNNLWQEGFLGHIDELVVEKNYRNQGIGTLLLDRLIEIARERGCRRVELDSAFHRKGAHQFYEQRGFESRALLFSKIL